MTIGFDIDNTITNTKEKIGEYFNLYNKNDNYHNYYDLPKEQFNDFVSTYIDHIQSEVTLKKGVKECFDYLTNHHHEIVLITFRNNSYSPNIKEITKNYFLNNNLKVRKIVFDSLNKGSDAKRMGVSLFVDDLESNLDSCVKESIKVIKFNEVNEDTKYPMVSNWDELLNLLKQEGF